MERRMKLLLTALTRTHRSAVCSAQRQGPTSSARCPSSSARCLTSSARCLTSSARCLSSSARCPSSSARSPSSSARCLTSSARCPSSSARCPSSSARCLSSSARCPSSSARGDLSPLREDSLIVGSSPELLQRLGSQVEVRTSFITEEEEGAFLRELEPGLKKKRYEFDHWDDAIHGYRETERLSWGAACEEVLNRVRSVAFPEGSQLLGPVHVLDLDQSGYIKPHIDSIKFCGSTIAGLSLLSDSIMRLVKEDAAGDRLDLLLPRRSLYILRDQARYHFTHEILKDEESVFNGQKVPRLRRISVICRNLPDQRAQD